MSAPEQPPSSLPPSEDLETTGSPVSPTLSPPTLSTISARDSELSCLTSTASQASSLLDQEQEEQGEEHPQPQHDLAPVHRILVQLAVSLQLRVDAAARELAAIRKRLAMEVQRTAETLGVLGEVKLPSGFPSSPLLACPSSPQAATIAAIHKYRDSAVAALTAQVVVLGEVQEEQEQLQEPQDFNTASDRLDSSFQQLRRWLDQLGAAARALQSCDGDTNTLRRFSSEQCRDIDSLEREAVLEKMGELSVRHCSVQSRKPVRSLGHTLDLQEIMLLAKNAKSLVYEVGKESSSVILIIDLLSLLLFLTPILPR